MSRDRNCLSVWFPPLAAAGIPVPRTELFDAGEDWHRASAVLDGPGDTVGERVFGTIVTGVRAAADRIGYPCFLRTGQGSGKHQWSECCHLTDADGVVSHVGRLIEWSCLVDMMGLSWQWWAVRELLPVQPVAVLPRYLKFPLVREYRMFISRGRVVGWQPYWPAGSIAEGFGRGAETVTEGVRLHAALYGAEPTLPDAVYDLAARVAAIFPEDWSVDVLDTERGWFVTDMAEAERSFRSPEYKSTTRGAA